MDQSMGWEVSVSCGPKLCYCYQFLTMIHRSSFFTRAISLGSVFSSVLGRQQRYLTDDTALLDLRAPKRSMCSTRGMAFSPISSSNMVALVVCLTTASLSVLVSAAILVGVRIVRWCLIWMMEAECKPENEQEQAVLDRFRNISSCRTGKQHLNR